MMPPVPSRAWAGTGGDVIGFHTPPVCVCVCVCGVVTLREAKNVFLKYHSIQ